MKETNQEFRTQDGHSVTLRNSIYDPMMWIVEVMKKSWLGKKKAGSYWFSCKEDAENFIKEMTGRRS